VPQARLEKEREAMKFVLSGLSVLLMTVGCAALVRGQSASQTVDSETCQGPVYKASEGIRRAEIVFKPDVVFTEEAHAHDVHGRVVVEAVLCRTGRVTDIKVVEGLPYGMSEAVVNAVKQYQFIPAEMGWHTVSQFIRMEFGFNVTDGPKLSQAEAAGREVEAIVIVGNRDISDSEIVSWVKTALGEPLDVEQVKQDFKAIMGKGYFNKWNSSVSVEGGKSGGLVVVFELYELPRISEVKFEGLNDVSDFEVLDSFKRQNLEIVRGGVYDTVIVRRSIEVLRRLLFFRGKGDMAVDVKITNIDPGHVVLTYVVKQKVMGDAR
jgi:TonB family protein